MTTNTTAATIGDPLGHPGFLRGEEEEEEEAVHEELCESNSDDDDDDVDRYVFLARQPAAADGDDDDGAMPGGGRGGRKRHLSEILAHASPSAKKARLGGAFPEESRSEGPVRSAERGVVDQGKKNKKRRRCGGEPQAKGAAGGKGSSGADRETSERSQHRDVTAGQKTSAAAAGAPRRFVCSLCGRSFGSYQALGGHVHLGHTKKAKNAIAAASHGDVTGDGCRNGKVAMDHGAGHGKEKTVVAASPGESGGDGKKTLGAATCRQDVDSSSGDSDSNEEMFIGAADHGGHRSDGNVEGEKVTVAIQSSHDDTDGTESKFAVRRWQELAAGAVGNANSIVRKTQYRCEVCGRECLSGQALGGHMRKHRKLSPHNGGKERRSLEVADGAGHGQEKTAVAASPGESGGDGKKTLGAATCCHDVDSSGSDSKRNGEMFIGAADHGDLHGAGIATSHDETYGTESKFAVGRCHELAIGNANSIVRKTQHRCEVCGKQCLSGQALGGHMRKHRKLSPHSGYDAGHGEKTAVAANHGKSKTLSAATCHQDGSSSDDSKSNEEMFIGAANHGDCKGTERMVAVGMCHELATGAIGIASSIVRKTHYRCEVCGKECLSGQALGRHMRKHRNRSPQDNGGKEGTSPEADRITNHRAANPQYGTRFDASLIGWV